jgi:hypothetical protein
VLHADETPVAMLKPGNGKTHRAYMWSYCTLSCNPTKAVVFDSSETRNDENVREFLRLDSAEAWQGTLVTDRFSGYRACFEKGVTSAQCRAHARRKFHELWANHGSEVGHQALRFHQSLSASNARSRTPPHKSEGARGNASRGESLPCSTGDWVGEPHPANRAGAIQLAVRRQSAGRQARCGDYEPAHGAHQRARTLAYLKDGDAKHSR